MSVVAIVQESPILLNREKTIALAVRLVEQASSLVVSSKRTLDVAGHYSRPDIFTLSVNTQHQGPVKFR